MFISREGRHRFHPPREDFLFSSAERRLTLGTRRHTAVLFTEDEEEVFFFKKKGQGGTAVLFTEDKEEFFFKKKLIDRIIHMRVPIAF
jgi:hypothetical protein